ncbi:MAG: hypothetical protein IAG13_06400 [Deltaproteobacteria bacterium]|nr:hypothetical protein [Nannocystaceae bacterium]
MKRTHASWIVAVALLACGSAGKDGGDDFADDVMDEPLPPKCEDTDAASCETTGASVPECTVSSDCSAGQVCGAAFDGDIGVLRCEASCIDADDPQRWCSDASACCDAGASCVRGLCIVDDETSSESGSGATGETSSTT